MVYNQPICIDCKHYDIEKEICKAFPIKIPNAIYLGTNKHIKPLKQQKNNFVFTPKINNDD